LELALWNVPSVLVYKNSALMIWIARKLVATTCAGLANIILDDKPVMTELIQEQASVQAIVEHTLPLLTDAKAIEQQQSAFEGLRARLGEKNPNHAVAGMILDMLQKQ
jgi:lipid-A-disaccharide synthase